MNTLQELPAQRLELNEIGTVRVESRWPLFFDAYRDNRSTGGFILIDPLSNLTVGAGMITAPYSVERVRERVTEADRKKRYGHVGFSSWLGDRMELGYSLERELFDRGCAVHVVEVEHPNAIRALTAAAWM